MIHETTMAAWGVTSEDSEADVSWNLSLWTECRETSENDGLVFLKGTETTVKLCLVFFSL